MAIEQEIRQALDEIESAEGVRILLACESGSRAWGFASKDSDYDVRFIYLHPPDWYLSIGLEEQRDVIERPIEGYLDISGWDLRKSLRLLRRSNPPLLEWLGSPIVYRENAAFAGALRTLAHQYHSSVACTYHYLHMARGNFREYLKGADIWRKKYLYVLRPLLAIRWIERDLGIVPTEFRRLLEEVIDDHALKIAIQELIREKQDGSELDRGPRIELISTFIEKELERLEDTPSGRKLPLPPVTPFNMVFHSMLRANWPGWPGL